MNRLINEIIHLKGGLNNPGGGMRRAVEIMLPAAIAYVLIYPLLAGWYFYPIAEYELYKSFMVNFIESLRRFELPVWNEFVGSGHPAMYFGHYPMTQNTIFYMLFGFTDQTYYFTKLLSLCILLSCFIYAGRKLGFGYLHSLIGGMIYFSVNFVIRIFPNETIGNLYPVYPVLVMLLPLIVSGVGGVKLILAYSLFYMLWHAGGNLTFVHMHVAMLSVVYWLSVIIIHGRELSARSALRYVFLYFVLLVLPGFALLYQYYFVIDVVSVSNRLKEGMTTGLLDPIVWRQLMASFKSSSYAWMAMIVLIGHAGARKLSKRLKFIEPIFIDSRAAAAMLAVFAILIIVRLRISSGSVFWHDYLTIANSGLFRIVLLVLFALILLNHRMRRIELNASDAALFIAYVSILSYYFFSPENIIGDVNGYDYDLFRELSPALRGAFCLSVLYSMRLYGRERVVKIMVMSLLVLYLVRSHLTIPILRFTGVVWYATRDGSIFSAMFAVLAMYGLREFIHDASALTSDAARGEGAFERLSIFHSVFKIRERLGRFDFGGSWAIHLRRAALLFLMMLLVRDSYSKMYKGTSHRFIYPLSRELAQSGTENWLIDAKAEASALRDKLMELDSQTDHFYRTFTPENSYIYLGGTMQDKKIRESVIYESSISRAFSDFYGRTVLQRPTDASRELKDVIPYFLYTRHVHEGLGLSHKDIQYRDFFIFSPVKDIEYLKNRNIEFMWEMMAVKYLIIGPQFSEALAGFKPASYYSLIAKYPKLSLNLYAIARPQRYLRYAVIELDKDGGMPNTVNSFDIGELKKLYSTLTGLDGKSKHYKLVKAEGGGGMKYYEIEADREAVFVDFESWHKNWKLKVNGRRETLHKAFQLFRAVRLSPGLNKIELIYEPVFFKPLFILSWLMIGGYVAMFAVICYKERKGVKITGQG